MEKLNQSYNGKILYTKYGSIIEVIKPCYIKGTSRYIINQDYPQPYPENLFGCQIITPDELGDMINHQEEYKVKYEEVQERQRKYDEYCRQLEEKEKAAAAAQAELEDLYGFADGKTPLQRGKILTTLMEKEAWRIHTGDNTVKVKYFTRKEFVICILQHGGSVENKQNTKSYNKNGELKTRANWYRLNTKEYGFYDINKTMYELGKYLVESGKINAIKEITL